MTTQQMDELDDAQRNLKPYPAHRIVPGDRTVPVAKIPWWRRILRRPCGATE